MPIKQWQNPEIIYGIFITLNPSPILPPNFSGSFPAFQRVSWILKIALTFKTIDLFNKSIKSKPPYDDDYNYTRLMTHIVKNITAESSSIITQMATELHGGIGFLSEFPIERWHREALITPIWEGASNIQALDMLEAIMKKKAHIKMLLDFQKTVSETRDAEASINGLFIGV